MNKGITKEEAYLLGRDCSINGADQVNCNFKIFETEELKNAWEEGNKDANLRTDGK